MKMNKLLIGISIILATLFIAGCSKPSVVGKWAIPEEPSKVVFEFKEGGVFLECSGCDEESWELCENGKKLTADRYIFEVVELTHETMTVKKGSSQELKLTRVD